MLLVIALMLNWYPVTVIPIACEMVLAVGVGYLIYRTRIGVLMPTIIALIVMYITIYIGVLMPDRTSGNVPWFRVDYMDLYHTAILVYSVSATCLAAPAAEGSYQCA